MDCSHRNEWALMGYARHHSFHTIPSATGGLTRVVCDRLREQGVDTASILAKAGLTEEEVDDPVARLDAQAQFKVLELAAKELGDDFLGFHLARGFELREIGLVYYVMSSSERLVDALRNAQRYSRIVNEGVQLRCNLDDGAVI